MSDTIEITLNGRRISLSACSPNLTLLEYLRSLGLTGAKEGCAEGDCGACSVVMVDRDNRGRPCYRAINSCLVPVCLLAGRELLSVEGIACQGKLHPVQQTMVHGHGSQCGYCTPGFIMSMLEGHYRDISTDDELDDQLCGNLCRCTGYRPIREAAIQAFAERAKANGQDVLAARLGAGWTDLRAVEYGLGQERFYRPASLADLLQVMASVPEGRLIAGATELGLDITKRYKKFPALISVEAVPELKELTATGSEWRIGAAVTLTQIEESMGEEFPALGEMLRVFGSRQIRNRATMGGNLVTASPIGDSAPVLLALDAKVVLASLQTAGRDGQAGAICERTLPIDQFFVSYRKSALRAGEILRTIIVPRFPRKAVLEQLCQWHKVSKRREMDISTVAACFRLELDPNRMIRHARLAYGGVAAMPCRALKTEAALLGKPWALNAIRAVLPILEGEFTPISDVRGQAEYRRGLVKSLLEKFYHSSNGVSSEPGCGLPGAACVRENLLGARAASRPASEVPTKALKVESRTTTQKAGIPQLRPAPHESAHLHVTGEAKYADDLVSGKSMLEVWPVCSPYASARLLKREAGVARAMAGIRAVLLAEDIPGVNDAGTKHDEPLLPKSEVSYHGQIVALVVGESVEACRAAAEKVVCEYEPLEPILTLGGAVAAESFHNAPNFIRRGNADEALAASPLRLEGTFELGGQEHFYLETHAAWAEPGEDGSIFAVSSTQHPSEVQQVIAHVLDIPSNRVVVQSPRMGGGFGGKETQAALPAALAALAALKTGQPVRVRFNRDQDMAITGHRHPFLARFTVGFDGQGLLRAARIHLCSNGGWALDLSQAVTDRALFHLDNAYYIPAVEFRGQVAKTNLSSNTAFRGFGGPQGMLVIEEILDRVARHLGLPPEMVRERNLYRGHGESRTTHYGQKLADDRIQTIWRRLKDSSAFAARRKEIARWNETHPHHKRGLAITPVKFGISFTVTHLNQAGALVLIYQDGTVQINHGGTEMGQGLHTNVTAIAARELGLKPEQIRIMPTSTDKVPNTSATAASCGTDLNGAAVRDACATLRARLAPVAADMMQEKIGRRPGPERLTFARGLVFVAERPRTTLNFNEVVKQAYLARMSLAATGFYATPGIHWDRAAGRGKPFHYFACGAAVAEVEVDGFTGMMRVLRADILHDAGDAINAGVSRGQIEGGFIQGMGWLTTEELKWDEKGRLLTHSPDTYKIPSIGDTPRVFNVELFQSAKQEDVIYGSKAVGEPPLMLAISVREAIRDAVSAFGPAGSQVSLASPATAEAIFMAIREQHLRKLQEPNIKLQRSSKSQNPNPKKASNSKFQNSGRAS